MHGKRVIIAGNSRTGKLLATNDNHIYVGTRLNARGKFDEKRFTGSERVARRNWEAWCNDVRDDAVITVKPKRMATPTKSTPSTNMTEGDATVSNKCPYDLSTFVTYQTSPRLYRDMTNADAYILISINSGTNKAPGKTNVSISIHRSVRDLISEAMPDTERFITMINETARLFVIKPDEAGNKLPLRPTKNQNSKRIVMSINSTLESIRRMFGSDVQRVYLDPEIYDDCVAFRPTGKVDRFQDGGGE